MAVLYHDNTLTSGVVVHHARGLNSRAERWSRRAGILDWFDAEHRRNATPDATLSEPQPFASPLLASATRRNYRVALGALFGILTERSANQPVPA